MPGEQGGAAHLYRDTPSAHLNVKECLIQHLLLLEFHFISFHSRTLVNRNYFNMEMEDEWELDNYSKEKRDS